MKFFLPVKKAIYLFVSMILTFNSMALADQQRQLSQHITISQALPLVQKFKNIRDFFLFADTILPGKGYDKWAELTKSLDSSEANLFKTMHADGMKLYLEGLKEPFEFSNNGIMVSYKGIGVVFQPELSLDESLQRIEKAWGGFKEFRAKKSSHSLLQIFAPSQAFAAGTFVGGVNFAKGFGVLVAGILVACVGAAFGIPALGMGAIAVAFAGLGYAAYGVGQYIYFLIDTKGNFVKDAKLSCSKSGEPMIDHTSVDNSSFQWTDYKSLNLSLKEKDAAEATLKEICKNPASVESFNRSFFALKKKIFAREADFFARDAAAKTPMGDPMGMNAPGAK